MRHLAVLLAVFGLTPLSAGAQSGDQDWDAVDAERYRTCLTMVGTDPDDAYEDGLAWVFEAGGAPAKHCVAVALIALGHEEEGAARLEEVAFSRELSDPDVKIELLSQSAASWMAAENAVEAHRVLTLALELNPMEPDVLIDRALASAAEDDYSAAAQDLSLALAERPEDALALRLRAEAWLELGEAQQASDDIARALRIAPDDIDTLLVRGKVRQALGDVG